MISRVEKKIILPCLTLILSQTATALADHLTSNVSMASFEEFHAMSMDTLKNYLAVRGITSSGKKKAELVALAYSCVALKIEIQDTRADLAVAAFSNAEGFVSIIHH